MRDELGVDPTLDTLDETYEKRQGREDERNAPGPCTDTLAPTLVKAFRIGAAYEIEI